MFVTDFYGHQMNDESATSSRYQCLKFARVAAVMVRLEQARDHLAHADLTRLPCFAFVDDETEGRAVGDDDAICRFRVVVFSHLGGNILRVGTEDGHIFVRDNPAISSLEVARCLAGGRASSNRNSRCWAITCPAVRTSKSDSSGRNLILLLDTAKRGGLRIRECRS